LAQQLFYFWWEVYSLQFIVIDGLDGSGKSTQAHRIAQLLQKHGKTVCLRVHPSTDNIWGRNAKRYLYAKGKSAHFSSALFYMMDVIRSILLYSWRNDDYIIFVRYLMGTAYLPSPLYKYAYCFFASIVPKSDKLLFLDISPKIAHKRLMDNRKSQEMFEEPKALIDVRKKALFLAHFGNWTIINADKSISEVEWAIKSVIHEQVFP